MPAHRSNARPGRNFIFGDKLPRTARGEGCDSGGVSFSSAEAQRSPQVPKPPDGTGRRGVLFWSMLGALPSSRPGAGLRPLNCGLRACGSHRRRGACTRHTQIRPPRPRAPGARENASSAGGDNRAPYVHRSFVPESCAKSNATLPVVSLSRACTPRMSCCRLPHSAFSLSEAKKKKTLSTAIKKKTNNSEKTRDTP